MSLRDRVPKVGRPWWTVTGGIVLARLEHEPESAMRPAVIERAEDFMRYTCMVRFLPRAGCRSGYWHVAYAHMALAPNATERT